jgi:hypothetical protein
MLSNALYFTPQKNASQARRCRMNALPTTGELFGTNQVSPETERCYKYQLRNFAQWMRDNCDVEDMEDLLLLIYWHTASRYSI